MVYDKSADHQLQRVPAGHRLLADLAERHFKQMAVKTLYCSDHT